MHTLIENTTELDLVAAPGEHNALMMVDDAGNEFAVPIVECHDSDERLLRLSKAVAEHDSMYVYHFIDNEHALAATMSSPFELKPAQWVTLDWNNTEVMTGDNQDQ